jgi:hypothetical protein
MYSSTGRANLKTASMQDLIFLQSQTNAFTKFSWVPTMMALQENSCEGRPTLAVSRYEVWPQLAANAIRSSREWPQVATKDAQRWPQAV